MADTEKRLNLRPRLDAAARLAAPAVTLADIGCDHGKLGISLLQRGGAHRVIAADISAPSLNKARALARFVGVEDRMDFRVANGLHALHPGEADAIVLCGMGGALIAELLAAACAPLMGARRAVLQPMRGVSELRRFLRFNGYCVLQDEIVLDAGRYYQVFSVARGEEPPAPAGWPENCFLMGAQTLRSPHCTALARHMLTQCTSRLALARNTQGEKPLLEKSAQLQTILALAEASHA